MLRSVLLALPCLLLAALVPGCVHSDQDYAAAAIAHELASLPRDHVTAEVVTTPRPEAKVLPPVKAQAGPLQLPKGLPGVEAPPLVIPDLDKFKTNQEKDKAIQAAFPPLPVIEPAPAPVPGPDGVPLDLPALQAMALANNPLVKQAASDINAFRGAAIQAGLYPNPTVGFEGDSIGQASTDGQLGGFFDQTIKTAGKLDLARAAGMMDVRNARLALRKTQLDVMTLVRTNYFAVLVAEESLAVARALATLTDEVYRLQLLQLRGNQAAAYEPLQLHVLAVQARANVVQAHNRYISAWRQLAAALGQPDLPPTQLAGRADVLAPVYPFDEIHNFMLANHTDLGTARNSILKARLNLQLARVTPIPDILTHVAVQKDNTSDPRRVQVNVQVGLPLPLWDRNQGGILQAEAQLARANQDVARVENDLNQRLAEAYERFRNNQILTSYYRDSVLPNQVRVYRAIYARYQGEPGKVSYNDIVVAQQTLATALQAYLVSLAAQWQAVVDLGNLLQTDDLYQLTVPPPGPCEPPPPPVSQLLDPHQWSTHAEPPLAGSRPTRAALAGPVGGDAP